MKLAHQFPWAPASAVALGLALRRRFLSDPDTPSTVTRRLQVTKVRSCAVNFLLQVICLESSHHQHRLQPSAVPEMAPILNL